MGNGICERAAVHNAALALTAICGCAGYLLVVSPLLLRLLRQRREEKPAPDGRDLP